MKSSTTLTILNVILSTNAWHDASLPAENRFRNPFKSSIVKALFAPGEALSAVVEVKFPNSTLKSNR